MAETLKQFLQNLSFIKINGIKRNAKGLLIELEKSNRAEFLDYIIEKPEKINENISYSEIAELLYKIKERAEY